MSRLRRRLLKFGNTVRQGCTVLVVFYKRPHATQFHSQELEAASAQTSP